MDAATKRLVRQRANNRCEYCGLHQNQSPLATLQIEHVTPRKHGGGDELENLALACIDCNLAKSSNIAGRDPETHELTPLFHPRVDQWDDHFSFDGIYVLGRTSVGRTTIYVLNMNSTDQLELRAAIQDF
ncbi:MAG TPA: HNH endonuclease [Planctomycetaceae bacterium]|nr:HNH endonuclease [Planctomycetaceae bacterium]